MNSSTLCSSAIDRVIIENIRKDIRKNFFRNPFIWLILSSLPIKMIYVAASDRIYPTLLSTIKKGAIFVPYYGAKEQKNVYFLRRIMA